MRCSWQFFGHFRVQFLLRCSINLINFVVIRKFCFYPWVADGQLPCIGVAPDPSEPSCREPCESGDSDGDSRWGGQRAARARFQLLPVAPDGVHEPQPCEPPLPVGRFSGRRFAARTRRPQEAHAAGGAGGRRCCSSILHMERPEAGIGKNREQLYSIGLPVDLSFSAL